MNENRWEYLLFCLKGKYGWFPYNNQIEQRTLKRDLNFGNIEIVTKTGLNSTDKWGLTAKFDFLFSKSSLMALSNKINLAEINKVNVQRSNDS